VERRIKGYLGKAAAVSAFVLLVLNVAILLSVQNRQKEMERMLTLALEQGKDAAEKALGAQEEKIKEAIAASEANINGRLDRIEKTMIAQGRLKYRAAGQVPAGEKASGKEVRLLYDEAYLEGKEGEAYRLLKGKKYAAAYQLYNEIVEKDPERLMSRYYRMYSLFYANEMNKENYEFLLKEIEYLRGKGMREDSFKKIETFIGKEGLF
jgi:hypothetical protein